jgi:hypothetical protein
MIFSVSTNWPWLKKNTSEEECHIHFDFAVVVNHFMFLNLFPFLAFFLGPFIDTDVIFSHCTIISNKAIRQNLSVDSLLPVTALPDFLPFNYYASIVTCVSNYWSSLLFVDDDFVRKIYPMGVCAAYHVYFF